MSMIHARQNHLLRKLDRLFQCIFVPTWTVCSNVYLFRRGPFVPMFICSSVYQLCYERLSRCFFTWRGNQLCVLSFTVQPFSTAAGIVVKGRCVRFAVQWEPWRREIQIIISWRKKKKRKKFWSSPPSPPNTKSIILLLITAMAYSSPTNGWLLQLASLHQCLWSEFDRLTDRFHFWWCHWRTSS